MSSASHMAEEVERESLIKCDYCQHENGRHDNNQPRPCHVDGCECLEYEPPTGVTMTALIGKLAQAERERDEALEQVKRYKKSIAITDGNFRRLEIERNGFRSLCMDVARETWPRGWRAKLAATARSLLAADCVSSSNHKEKK